MKNNYPSSKNELLKRLSNNIYNIMMDKGITPYDIARVTSIKTSSTYDYMYGERLPNTYNLCILANYFECSVEDLLSENGVKKKTYRTLR